MPEREKTDPTGDPNTGVPDCTRHYDTYAAKVEFIINCKVYFP